MNTKKALNVATAVYLLVAIVTYGDAIDHFYKTSVAEVEKCKATAKNPDFCEMRLATGMAGAVSAVVWPLYWSYRIQRSEQ